MAATKNIETPAVEVKNDEKVETASLDPKELSQAIRLLRFKLGNLRADAGRKAPFMSKSQEVAQAKYAAAIRSVTELANYVDQQEV